MANSASVSALKAMGAICVAQTFTPASRYTPAICLSAASSTGARKPRPNTRLKRITGTDRRDKQCGAGDVLDALPFIRRRCGESVFKGGGFTKLNQLSKGVCVDGLHG